MNAIISKFLQNVIFYIFFVIILFIAGINLFHSAGHETIGQASTFWFNAITILIALVIVVLFYKYREKILKLISGQDAPYFVLSILLFSIILQLLTIHLFNVHPTWDFKVIIQEANNLVNQGILSDYFVQYPNNTLLVFILGLIGKLISPQLFVYQFFNIIVITISQYLIFQIVKKLLGRSTGIIALILSVLFLPYIFFAPIVYTDTISLVFLLLPLNLLISEDGKFKIDLSRLLLASSIFAIGGLLKGSLIIFLIALSITIFLFMNSWKKLFFVIPFICFFIINGIFSAVIYGSDLIDKNDVEKYSFPVTHWIMMGQNKENYGKWSGQDVNYTSELIDDNYPREEISKKHLEELKNRFEERGLKGNLSYNLEKVKHTWTDGTYYSLNKLNRAPVHPDNIHKLTNGWKGDFVLGVARIQHLLVLIGLLIFAISMRKNVQNPIYLFTMLSVIGFFLFFIMWEARSRYILSLTPILIILSIVGYFSSTIKYRKQSQIKSNR